MWSQPKRLHLERNYCNIFFLFRYKRTGKFQDAWLKITFSFACNSERAISILKGINEGGGNDLIAQSLFWFFTPSSDVSSSSSYLLSLSLTRMKKFFSLSSLSISYFNELWDCASESWGATFRWRDLQHRYNTSFLLSGPRHHRKKETKEKKGLQVQYQARVL